MTSGADLGLDRKRRRASLGCFLFIIYNQRAVTQARTYLTAQGRIENKYSRRYSLIGGSFFLSYSRDEMELSAKKQVMKYSKIFSS